MSNILIWTTVSCAIWQQNECQKVDLTVLDISSSVIRKVGKAKHSHEYFYLGLMFSLILAFIPGLFRLQASAAASNAAQNGPTIYGPINDPKKENESVGDLGLDTLLNQIPDFEMKFILASIIAPSNSWFIRYVAIVAIIERFCMSLFFFFLLCVAERTYKEVSRLVTKRDLLIVLFSASCSQSTFVTWHRHDGPDDQICLILDWTKFETSRPGFPYDLTSRNMDLNDRLTSLCHVASS